MKKTIDTHKQSFDLSLKAFEIYRKGDIDLALDTIDEAIKLCPLSGCYYAKAVFLLGKHNYKEYEKYGMKMRSLAKNDLLHQALENINIALDCESLAIYHSCKAEICLELAKDSSGKIEFELDFKEMTGQVSETKSDYMLDKNQFLLNSLAEIKQAILLDQSKPNYYILHSNILLYENKEQEALDIINDAIALIPNDIELYKQQCLILRRLRKYDNALVSIEKAITIQSENGDLYFTKSSILEVLNRIQEAINACDIAISLNPDSYKMLEHKYKLCERFNEFDDALSAMNTLLAKFQEYEDIGDVYLDKYYILLSLKRNDEAYEALNISYERNGHTPVWEKVLFFLRTGNFAQARVELTKIIDEEYQDIDQLFIELYSEKFFEAIISFYQEFIKTTNAYIDWLYMGACINIGKMTEATGILQSFSSEKLYNSVMFSLKKRSTNKKSPHLDIRTLDDYILSALPPEGKYDINSFFSCEIPYDKMTIEPYIMLLSKLFINADFETKQPTDSQKLLSDDNFKDNIYPEFLKIQKKWDTDKTKIVKTSEYGKIYKEISIKSELLEWCIGLSHKLSEVELVFFLKLVFQIQKQLTNELNQQIHTAKEKERNRIMSNLSHSIKNLLVSVSRPLSNLKEEVPGKVNIIENALRGTNLIYEIVNSINSSFSIAIDDLIFDINNPGKSAISLKSMIINSLIYSIGNMFDKMYFSEFNENYFPEENLTQSIAHEWHAVSQTDDIEKITTFIRRFFFDLRITLVGIDSYKIGNVKSSAIKLLILFQEIIFNAVKYCSYVLFKQRKLHIELIEHDGLLTLNILNSYNPEIKAKTTGIGQVVIENFTKVLDCKPIISENNNLYSFTITFQDYWRSNE